VASYPILLYLITIITYIFIFIYFFADPVLCQDENSSLITQVFKASTESLGDLKTCLDSTIVQYNKVYNQYLNYVNLLEEGMRRPTTDFNIIMFLENNKTVSLHYAEEDMNKIRNIENKIMALNPNFKSSLPIK